MRAPPFFGFLKERTLSLCLVSTRNVRTPMLLRQVRRSVPLFGLDTQRAFPLFVLFPESQRAAPFYGAHKERVLSLFLVFTRNARSPMLRSPQATCALTLFGLFTQHDLQYLH